MNSTKPCLGRDEKMANERTPLITTVVIGPVRQRYPHRTIRRFCSVALGSSLIALFIVFFVTLVFAPHHTTHRHWPGHNKTRLTYDDLKGILLDTPSPAKAAEWSKYYTSGPHLAGKNLSQVSPLFSIIFLDITSTSVDYIKTLIDIDYRPNGRGIVGMNGESNQTS